MDCKLKVSGLQSRNFVETWQRSDDSHLNPGIISFAICIGQQSEKHVSRVYLDSDSSENGRLLSLEAIAHYTRTIDALNNLLVSLKSYDKKI